MDNFPSKLDLCITLSDDLKLLSDIWQIADLCRAFSNKFLAELSNGKIADEVKGVQSGN